MSDLFIVNQVPGSSYNDKEGQRYEYPTRIPFGKQIKENDILIFNLSKKYAIKLGLKDKRITGIAKIKEITKYNNNDKEMAIATYAWFKIFKVPLSFEQIGGDPRINENNSMNKVQPDSISQVLIPILELYV